MKKSVLAITLLCSMMTIPMSMNANTMLNQPEYESQYHHHFYDDCATIEEVDDLVREVRNTSFDDNKIDVAMSFLHHCPMDAYSIGRVARAFTFESGKLQFLKRAFRYCVNPQDYYKVRSVLDFSSDRDELMRYIDRHY